MKLFDFVGPSFPNFTNGWGNNFVPTNVFFPSVLQKNLEMMMAGEHHPRISNTFAILDISCRLMRLLVDHEDVVQYSAPQFCRWLSIFLAGNLPAQKDIAVPLEDGSRYQQNLLTLDRHQRKRHLKWYCSLRILLLIVQSVLF